MNALTIYCKFKNGTSLTRGFDTIMDFIEAYEHRQFFHMENNIEYIKLKFFDNNFNKKKFKTIHNAYIYCQMIIK